MYTSYPLEPSSSTLSKVNFLSCPLKRPPTPNANRISWSHRQPMRYKCNVSRRSQFRMSVNRSLEVRHGLLPIVNDLGDERKYCIKILLQINQVYKTTWVMNCNLPWEIKHNTFSFLSVYFQIQKKLLFFIYIVKMVANLHANHVLAKNNIQKKQIFSPNKFSYNTTC